MRYALESSSDNPLIAANPGFNHRSEKGGATTIISALDSIVAEVQQVVRSNSSRLKE